MTPHPEGSRPAPRHPSRQRPHAPHRRRHPSRRATAVAVAVLLGGLGYAAAPAAAGATPGTHPTGTATVTHATGTATVTHPTGTATVTHPTGTTPATSPVRPVLPEPSGRYRVGETALRLVDPSRKDPWKPATGHRQLMVSVFYPAAARAARTPASAQAPRTAAPAPYMLPAAAAHFDAVTADQYLGLDVPAGRADWAGTVTHVLRDAPAASARPGRRRPVLIYSPGLGEPRTWDTTLVADLASRGFVVVTVDNTYESPEVQFPDGTLATMVTPSSPDAFIRKSLDVRVADTSFVLDAIGSMAAGHDPDADGAPLPEGLGRSLDPREVGMFGHSMGGTAAALAMDADPRIRAGVDMDGNLTYYDGSLMPVAEHGLDRPFLLMGKDGTTDTGPGWQAFLANTPGWAEELTLRGSDHASFTDAEALIPQLGLPATVRTADIGTIAPATAVRTVEAYLAASFGHWLLGTNGRLLNGPSARYPAMEFVAGSGSASAR